MTPTPRPANDSPLKTRTRSRLSSAARGYDAQHRRWREAVLARDKVCTWSEGCDQPATEADHIVPLSRGGARFDLANGQGLCRPHHSTKSASEDGGYGNETKPERELASYLSNRTKDKIMIEPAVTHLRIEEVPIDDLRPDPANPRRISDHQLEALTRSLKEYGFVQPVLVRREDKIIIGGHQRLLAARRLGYKTVPTIFLDLTAEQARVLNLSLNRISGEWDQELLARLLADLKPVEEIDLTLSGFSEDELDKLLKSLDVRDKKERVESFDLDAALEAARAAPRAQHGEQWALGDHRVMCGDSTDAAAVSRLLDGRRAGMAFIDPPYNVGLGDHGGQQRNQRRRRIQNDALPAEQWQAFVRAWARNLLTSVDGAVYVCMSSKEWPLVSSVLEEEGGHWSDTLIWTKDRFVLGRADYQRQYEPIWYGWREGSAHFWRGDRNQGDLLAVKRRRRPRRIRLKSPSN